MKQAIEVLPAVFTLVRQTVPATSLFENKTAGRGDQHAVEVVDPVILRLVGCDKPDVTRTAFLGLPIGDRDLVRQTGACPIH